jgi:DNA-binding MarR family transcriptional regulator
MKFKEAVKQRTFRSNQAEAALNIIFTANWLDDVIRSSIKDYNITPEQYNVLRILKGKHPDAYALQEIRDRMLNRWSNVSRLVDKLKKKGYLTRQQLESNRRKVEIRLTEKGFELLDDLDKSPPAGSLFDHGLSSNKAKQLTNLLDEFRNNLDKFLEEVS